MRGLPWRSVGDVLEQETRLDDSVEIDYYKHDAQASEALSPPAFRVVFVVN